MIDYLDNVTVYDIKPIPNPDIMQYEYEYEKPKIIETNIDSFSSNSMEYIDDDIDIRNLGKLLNYLLYIKK